MKPPRMEEPGRVHTLSNGRRVMVSAQSAKGTSAAETAFFANYSEYSKTLRAWLVAYGIGGPVLFLTNKGLADSLKLSVYHSLIVNLFLAGVVLQVFLAFINKWCAWHMYVGEYDTRFKEKVTYKIWAWFNERSWIDLLIDCSSLAFLSASTWLVVRVFS